MHISFYFRLVPLLYVMNKLSRPIIALEVFERAIEEAELTNGEKELIDYIRYIGTFNQVILTQALKLRSKPPVLSVLCIACRKIGNRMPEHFVTVREWSKNVSSDNVHWDGDLICSAAWNIDGQRLSPECGTSQYHTFAVHKELFQGLG